MKKKICTMMILVVFFWLGKTAAASGVKIGYVDLQRVIETSEKGKAFRERLFKFRREKEKILAAKQEELNRLVRDYQQKSFTLSERARLDKEQEIRQKELEFKNLSDSYRQEILLEGKKLQTIMFKELKDIIREIGEKEHFTIILDKDVLLYASDTIDITDKVIQLYNQKSKGETK